MLWEFKQINFDPPWNYQKTLQKLTNSLKWAYLGVVPEQCGRKDICSTNSVYEHGGIR